MAYTFIPGYSGAGYSGAGYPGGMGMGMLGPDMGHVYRGIWIGGHTVLKSSTLLQSGIHNVVNTAMELVDGGGLVDWMDLNRHGLAVQHVPLDDSPGQRIVPASPALQAALQFIDQCVRANAPVLVNCAMGVSRSPSVVIAYLMMYQSMPYDQAHSVVVAGRPAANPNPGFEAQLRQLDGSKAPYSQATPMYRPPAPGPSAPPYTSAPMPNPASYAMPGAAAPTAVPYVMAAAPVPNAAPFSANHPPSPKRPTTWSVRGFFSRFRQS
eukprot:GGOE01021759.1.p1 GENE.GGOE01021759.1~~GGOE01021759.1.p1  ORF type:complete len:275 (+),score=35.50 GGOE01021759.1:25-825(+)